MADLRYSDAGDTASGRGASRLLRRRFLGHVATSAAAATGLAACAKVAHPVALARPVTDDDLDLDAPAPLVSPQVEMASPAPEPPPPTPLMPVFYRPEYTLAGFSYDTTRKAAWLVDSLAAKPLAGL